MKCVRNCFGFKSLFFVMKRSISRALEGQKCLICEGGWLLHTSKIRCITQGPFTGSSLKILMIIKSKLSTYFSLAIGNWCVYLGTAGVQKAVLGEHSQGFSYLSWNLYLDWYVTRSERLVFGEQYPTACVNEGNLVFLWIISGKSSSGTQ